MKIWLEEPGTQALHGESTEEQAGIKSPGLAEQPQVEGGLLPLLCSPDTKASQPITSQGESLSPATDHSAVVRVGLHLVQAVGLPLRRQDLNLGDTGQSHKTEFHC